MRDNRAAYRAHSYSFRSSRAIRGRRGGAASRRRRRAQSESETILASTQHRAVRGRYNTTILPRILNGAGRCRVLGCPSGYLLCCARSGVRHKTINKVAAVLRRSGSASKKGNVTIKLQSAWVVFHFLHTNRRAIMKGHEPALPDPSAVPFVLHVDRRDGAATRQEGDYSAAHTGCASRFSRRA